MIIASGWVDCPPIISLFAYKCNLIFLIPHHCNVSNGRFVMGSSDATAEK